MRFIERIAGTKPKEIGVWEKMIRDCSGQILAVPDVYYLGAILNLENIHADGRPPDLFPNRLDPRRLWGMIRQLEVAGTFIPNNFNLNKQYYPLYLRARGIPMANFVILENGYLSQNQIESLVVSGSDRHPQLFIVKATKSHRGENIRFFTQDTLKDIRTNDGGLIIQNFWWPRGSHVTDVRVVTIGGEPVTLCARQAKDPLVDACGNLIEYPPSLSRIFAKITRGGRVTGVDSGLRNDLFDLARDTCQIVRQYAAEVRKASIGNGDPKRVNLGFIAVDILMGEDGLSVCEVDTCPGLHSFSNSDTRMIEKKYADYLKAVWREKQVPIVILDLNVILRRRCVSQMPIKTKVLMEFFQRDGIPLAVPKIN